MLQSKTERTMKVLIRLAVFRCRASCMARAFYCLPMSVLGNENFIMHRNCLGESSKGMANGENSFQTRSRVTASRHRRQPLHNYLIGIKLVLT
jgi:hypothetical protein